MVTYVYSEAKEFVINLRLKTGSKQMSEDGECLQIRIKET